MHELIQEIITNGIIHNYYHRTKEVSKYAYIMNTGKGQEDMLTSLRKRESKEQMQQRIDITNSITQVPVAITTNYYNKVRRVSGVLKRIDSEDKERLELLENQVKNFHEHQSLEEYIHDTLSHYTFYDPNAYLLILPETVYNETGQAVDLDIKHSIVRSKDVLYVDEYKGNAQWIITKKERYIKDKYGRDIEVYDYCYYGVGMVIEYIDVTEGGEVGKLGTVTLENKNKQVREFAMFEYPNTSKTCPAITLRSYLDAQTHNKTGVTPLEPAMPLLKKLININSLNDLVTFLHTFPKRFVLARTCQDDQCDNGYYPDMTICPSCKGTGADHHTSEQDIVVITVPDGALANELPDLQRFSHTEQPDIATPQYLDGKVNELIRSILLAIFNQEVFSMAEIAKTATEKMLEYQNIYDKLQPYTERISIVYQRVVKLMADYYEIEDIEVEHSFPLDYQFESEVDLIARYNTAKTAGLSQEILNSYETKILERQYRNNPYKIMLEKALMQHKPFSDKSESAIISILTNRANNDYDKVLWENWSKVREIISREFEEFPYSNTDRQIQIMQSIVDEITNSINYLQPLDAQIVLE